MSTKAIVTCDECHEEIETAQGECATEYAGWGKVSEHDEHYCPECWPEYCEQYGVYIKTGKDL